MSHYVEQLIAFVGQNPWLAYGAVFLAALLEAVPVIGSAIPGATIILALGALIPESHLSIVGMILSVMVGALIGDLGAYTIGYRNQGRILSIWPLSRYPALVEQSGRFFAKHGGLAVFLARFLAPFRAFVPITAGALGMRPPLFVPVNVVAVMCWSTAHILPGVLAVTALEQFGGWREVAKAAQPYAIPIVLVSAGLAAVVIWWRSRKRLAAVGKDGQ